MLKWLSIRFVLLYRAYAPMRIRDRCRHTPSCSKYTLVALKRFGFITGWKLGLARIYRCRPPNGGCDYPPKK
ncbi:membrane protein insertion efficiency factor YidD [Yersinia enterocolitica]|uniref:membrane protein insertion efficiency factor YidD n=2 Tax=Yersinia enterocolitica TaxID=630 RepID=UPI001C60BF4F|nr:membrane protein insertion efficiency factor YidD [Yersinia enterocolitica]MBW5836184.1 membrane protein insertion efficiency factor YidD [Yersinia enterocolitica]HEA9920789.1 membrane protein insertion efficiency factor YidD [Yersinia enterocolitica]HEI6827937.1 membrane protein insertion efficiency factor YidD [Yersinia enterocolitica]HEK6318914.1 membrane protein insertion efficiency factor YidD [Yersinia enterocolitica]